MPTVPMPLPVPQTNSSVTSNLTEGGSLFSMYMNKEIYMLAYKERQRRRRASGSNVQCAKETCTIMIATGPNSKYCNECGANQDIEETRQLRETLNKLNS